MKRKLCAIVIAGICFLPGLLLAQDDETIQHLDEVVITATQTENSIMKTASNISVISAEDIARLDAANVAEVLRTLPGISYTNASGLEPKINLRGTKMGMSSGALVLLNGIPVNIGKFGYVDFEALPIENVEKIEVVKGPMSSLYGGNAARGVINIITKRGKDDFGGAVSAIVGSNNDRRLSALINGGNGKWDYNLNVKKREEDGYRDETYIDNFNVNGELGYWISDDVRVGGYVNVMNKERSLAKKLTEEERDEDPTQATDYSLTDNDDLITGINLDITKNLFDVKTTVYYKNRDKTYENYLMATSTPYLEELEEDVFGMNSIVTYKGDLMSRANKLSVGFDYDNDQIDLTTTKAASKTIGIPYTEPYSKKSGDFASEVLGVFIQDEFSILDNLTLTAGLRYDYFEFDNDADYDFSQDGKYDYNDNPDYDKLNPKVSLNYQPIAKLGLYGSYSRSYRPPSIYDYYASGSYSSKNAYVLEPETFTQYEAGLRYQHAAWLNIDACVYHMLIDDMMDSAYEDGKYMGKQNIGEATTKGFELGLSGTPCKYFNYNVAYTYTDARYSDNIFTKSGNNIKDNRITKVPYNALNVDLGFLLFENDAFKVMWDNNVMAQDGFAMNNENTSTYNGYALVNTKLRLKYNDITWFVAVDNVLDKDYDGYAYTSSGTDYYYPADGATVAVGMEYKF